MSVRLALPVRHRIVPILMTLVLSEPLPGGAQEAGKRSELWETHCAVCHGDDGKAQTEEGRKKRARDLTSAKWQRTVNDDRLIRSVTKGREKMPSFRKKLTDDEIKTLVREVRELGKAGS